MPWDGRVHGLILGCTIAAVAGPPAHAATIWADWTAASVGLPGTGGGSLDGVPFQYSGEVLNPVINGTSLVWAPEASFVGGTSTTSPSSVGDAIASDGTYTGTNTITFAGLIANPVFAFWSLGNAATPASFTFNATPVLQAGGPSAALGGASITVSGNTVTGREGNGVVQFSGNYRSLSWTTTPDANFDFTVGHNASTVSAPRTDTGTTVWTNWLTSTLGTPGSASGTAGGITVAYTGEIDSTVLNGTSPVWAPSSSFIGGNSTTSPASVGDALSSNGTSGATNQVTFSAPVVDPMIAFWSLGSPGIRGSFTFNATPVLQVGGPNTGFGGQPITVTGNVVNGFEGNGVVEFPGTYTTLSWINTPETSFDFTIGFNGLAPVPEPGPLGAWAAALAMLWIPRDIARRRTPRREHPAKHGSTARGRHE